jgi:polysaccharide chain length determinant protein (PEP-CTERM system associated)
MDEFRSLLRRYMLGAWRNRWFALAMSWLVCLAGWAFVSTIPNQYECDARLYVDSDAVLTPLLHGLALDDTPSNQVDMLQRTLLSRPNLEKLISKTDLELSITNPTDLEQQVAGLTTAIRLTPQTRNLFTISYRNATPKLAYDVVQSILSIFIENKIGSSRADMENGRTFLEQQIAQYEQQLREAETKRATFRAKYLELLPSDAGVSGLEAARAQIQALEGQLKDVLNKRDMMRREMSTLPATLTLDAGGAAGGGAAGNQQLAQAEARLAELRLRYTDQHPDVIAALNLVTALKAAPPQSVATAQSPARSVPNPVYEQMRMQLFEQETVIASLQRQIDDASKERDRLQAIARGEPELQAEYINLNRDYDVLHQNYTELLSRRESMRIAAAADNNADKVKIQIIDPPQLPRIPVAPKRGLLITGVLLAGLGAGAGLAVLLMQFDKSFHSVEDLRVLGLPVVGGISLDGMVAVPLRRRLLAVASFAVAGLLLCAIYGGLFYRLLHTSGVVA